MTRDDVMRETVQHVRRVGFLMMNAVKQLQERAIVHDASKFEDDEFDSFATVTPRLKGLTYGSDEYRASLKEIKPAIERHYSRNSHHPEHHAGGIYSMTLLDLIEMLADWKAAGERHADGNLLVSIRSNMGRFGYDEGFAWLLIRTAVSLGWLPEMKETQ